MDVRTEIRDWVARWAMEWGSLTDDQRGTGSLGGLRGGPGMGFWPNIGGLSVRCVAVMCAGLERGGTRDTTWVPLEERLFRAFRPKTTSDLCCMHILHATCLNHDDIVFVLSRV